MKPLVLIFALSLVSITQSNAQEKQEEHLLDGTSMNYYYQNGTAVHVDFDDGQFKYQWIAGPNTDAVGKVGYRSRKIGDKLYMVNFFEETNLTFVTIVFNFNQNVLHTSALIAGGSDQRQILFDGGIIENLTLIEK